jgi:hypothetical protein
MDWRRAASDLLTAPVILAIGVLGLVMYAFPGYLSYDSVHQLAQARDGTLGDWHPPAMAALWRLVEVVITGSLGMLLLQIGCFVAGVYLLLRRVASARIAAACTVAIAWFPPIAFTLGVIWKDSQMVAYCVLGAALIGSPRRGTRLAGLGLLALGSAMRHNAFTITFPLVVLGYAAPSRRLLTACVAWLAITGAAELVNLALVDHPEYPWHRSVALVDIAGTVRWAPPMTDAELAPILAGTPLRSPDHLHERTLKRYNPAWMFEEIFDDGGLFRSPTDDDHAEASIGRAWRSIVLDHPRAYLHYRWDVARELLVLPGAHQSSAVYTWFTDIQDLPYTAKLIDHDAAPSHAQHVLQPIAHRFDRSVLFRPWLYLVALLAFAPFVRRDRVAVALIASALVSELALLAIVPTPDFRYSIWLVTTALLVAALALARRVRPA